MASETAGARAAAEGGAAARARAGAGGAAVAAQWCDQVNIQLYTSCG